MTSLATAPPSAPPAKSDRGTRSAAAEWGVLGHMLRSPQLIGDMASRLEADDFSYPDVRLLFETAVERHLSGHMVDPLVLGELCRDELALIWRVEADDASSSLAERVRQAVANSTEAPVAVVKELSTRRKLIDCCLRALASMGDHKLGPEEIGDRLSTEVHQLTAGSRGRSEVLSWMDVGRSYARQLQRVMQARQEGFEVGVYTGLSFIDRYTMGIGPGELCFVVGEPGAGKTALAWACALGFARRQSAKPHEARMGTLILSMEMGLYSATQRVVQNLTGIDGQQLREGALSRQQYQTFLREWKNNENLPLHFNFAPNFRLSQMRALVIEAIHRHNVGFVVIDHFRMIDTDRNYSNPNQEDEVKVRFLKENLARDLEVAVMCLAHTNKPDRMAGAKPRLADLRGSYMIAAHADQIGFLWSSYKHLSEDERIERFAAPTDMELSWEKNRFGAPVTAELTFVAETMRVLPR